MKVKEYICDSVYFGIAISIFTYWIGCKMNKKWKVPIFNPLLIAMILIMAFLSLFHIDYSYYDQGAKYLTYLLTPATVCLAVPLYKQVQILKDNMALVFVGIFCGCLAHIGILLGIAFFLQFDTLLLKSLLCKSITTPIALGVCQEISGIPAITVTGVVIAGTMGAVVGPSILKIFHIEDPKAQGLALGTASHAVGTSKAVELGEVQAATSTLAIVVTGVMTVILVPIIVTMLNL